MTDERAAVLANDHAVIRLFDHGALAVVLGALLPLLPHRLELLLLLALIGGSGAGLQLTRPRILRPRRSARRRRALGFLALVALRRAGRLARRLLRRPRLAGTERCARRLACGLLGRLRLSRRAGRLAGLLRRSRLAGTGLHARSLAGLLRRSRRDGPGLLGARRLPPLLLGLLALRTRRLCRRLLGRARLGGAARLGPRRLSPLQLLALRTRRRGRLLGRARLTGRRPAWRRAALLPLLAFLLLGGTLRLALRARRTAILLGPLRTLRWLSALSPGMLRLGLRLRPSGRSGLLVLAPLLPGLLRLGLRQQWGRRHRRRDLRGQGAAAQRQRGDHDRARKQRAFLGNQVHVPASEIWVWRHSPYNRARTMAIPGGTDLSAGRGRADATDASAQPTCYRRPAAGSTGVPEPMGETCPIRRSATRPPSAS